MNNKHAVIFDPNLLNPDFSHSLKVLIWNVNHPEAADIENGLRLADPDCRILKAGSEEEFKEKIEELTPNVIIAGKNTDKACVSYLKDYVIKQNPEAVVFAIGNAAGEELTIELVNSGNYGFSDDKKHDTFINTLRKAISSAGISLNNERPIPAFPVVSFRVNWDEDCAALIESSGRLIFLSNPLQKILGISESDFQGFSARLLVAKDFRQSWDDIYRLMTVKGRANGDLEFSLGRSFRFGGHVNMFRNDGPGTSFESYYLIIDNIRKIEEQNRLLSEPEAKVLDSLITQIAVVNSDNRIVLVNRAWEKFESEKKCDQVKQLPDTDFEVYSMAIDAADKKGFKDFAEHIPFILNGAESDFVTEVSFEHSGLIRWFRLKATPAELNGERHIVVARTDITPYKEAEIELSRSEEKFRSMVANSSDLTTVVDAKGVILYNSPSIEKILGFTQNERIGQSMFDLIHPDDIDKISKLMRENAGVHGAVVSAEFWIRKSDDSYICMEAIAKNLLRDPNIGGIVINSRDITDRKYNEQMIQAALSEKEALLREVHHRVKNNLQLVSSLLKLQQNHIHDAAFKRIFHESMNRIKALSLMHQRLFSENSFSHIDFGHYIESIVHNLRETYGTEKKNIKFIISADKIPLNLETAVPSGLLINEILTNSIRHGFNSKDSGEIRIDLRSAGQMILTISDNGSGFGPGFDPSKMKTLGFQLINTLSAQLNSEIEIENKNGAKFTIKFSNLNYKERGID